MEWLIRNASKLDPLDWWLVAFVLTGLAVGILSGYFAARKIQPKGFRWRVIGHEIFWTVFNILVSAFTLGAVKSFLQSRGLVVTSFEHTAPWVIALEFAIYFFAFDTYFYWMHRLMHKEPFYSWSHKVHHGSVSTNPLTSLSVSPVESFVNGMFVPFFMTTATFLAAVIPGLSPIHAPTVGLITASTIIMGFYVHSGFEFLPRWWNSSWLTKWFITATFHDQHHRFFKGNYGGYTTIWDRACGTMRAHYESDFEKITTRAMRPMLPRPGRAKPAAQPSPAAATRAPEVVSN